MSDDELFAFFDPEEEVAITERNLPHWEQAGKTYFSTFRTEDSLPQAVLAPWFAERDDWLNQHGIDAAKPVWREALAKLPAPLRREFHRVFSARFQRLLDDGHGACVLRQPPLAKIVHDSLLHFDGDRYRMGDFVVMPNHVHLLASSPGPWA